MSGFRAVLLAGLGVCGLLQAATAQAAEDPASSAARAQAAFFARDAAALAELAAATAPWSKSTAPRELYAHAYVQFRAQQVAMIGGRNGDVEKAGDACVAATEAALALEAGNPRAILTDAFSLYVRPKIAGGDKAKGCARFRAAAAAFDAAPPAAASGIAWGAPEAHYWAGRCATEAGDPALARREYEKALALAPDFAAARKALGR